MSIMGEEFDELKEKVFEAARDGKALTLYAMLCDLCPTKVHGVLTAFTEQNGEKTTPLLIASRNGHHRLLKLLLKYFCLDIEQVGTVKSDGYLIEGATGLWCAAAAGHFDVVRTLVEFGADVNHTTRSNSTPLRAACFDGRLDIVKYLVEHHADVHIANKYNNTCLMLACYRGHNHVVRFLLQSGADPNATANGGATALHYSAERGYYQITQDLIEFGAKMSLNDQNMSPQYVAAEAGRRDIAMLFSSQPGTTRLQRIETMELLGAYYAVDKDNENVDNALDYLIRAMHARCNPGPGEEVLLKEVRPPVPAYENRTEATSVAELEAMRNDPEAIHMEALMVRERILGEHNIEILQPIIFHGAVFADAGRFDRCTALWMRALVLRQVNDRPIAKDLLRFAEVFSQMKQLGVQFEVELALTVFEYNVFELIKDNARLKRFSAEEYKAQVELIEINIHTALYLLVILSRLERSREEEFRFCKTIYSFVQIGLVLSRNGYTPLHMVLDEHTLVDDSFVNEVVHFPDVLAAGLLIDCGADVNATDKVGQTPLHVIAQYAQPIKDFLSLHGSIMQLLAAGAHVDPVDAEGLTPLEASTTGVAEYILRKHGNVTLKCLAARTIKRHKLQYKGHIPQTLEEFVDMH